MKCEQCWWEGKVAWLKDDGPLSVDASSERTFTDDEGALHSHNEAVAQRSYKCTNGHQVVHRYITPCPTCQYKWLRGLHDS